MVTFVYVFVKQKRLAMKLSACKNNIFVSLSYLSFSFMDRDNNQKTNRNNMAKY